jgi:hypothetical protein
MQPGALIECAALVLIGLACSTEPDVDPQGCPQTREFGNFGCARASGVVLDQAGDPLAGAHILFRPHEEGGFDVGAMETGPDGRFALEVHDFEGNDLASGTRDTMAFVILAAFPVTTNFLLRDSVILDGELAPVGERPQSIEASLTLTVPATSSGHGE